MLEGVLGVLVAGGVAAVGGVRGVVVGGVAITDSTRRVLMSDMGRQLTQLLNMHFTFIDSCIKLPVAYLEGMDLFV